MATIALLVAASVLWGSAPALLKLIAPELGPSWTAELRLILAASIATIAVLVRGRRLELRRLWKAYAIGGLLNIALPYWLNAYAVQSLSASTLSCFIGLSPLIAACIAAVSNRRMSAVTALGLFLGLFGVATVAGAASLASVPGKGLAICAALAASTCTAAGAIYLQRHLKDRAVDTVLAGNLILGSVCMLPSLAVVPIPSSISMTAIWALLAVSSVATVLPFYLFFYVIDTRGAQVAVLVNYLIPLFGVLWGALLLKEQLTVTQAVGLSIIFAGVWLLVRTPGNAASRR